MTAIAAAGFLVAFGNRTDAHPRLGGRSRRHVRDPVLTCEAVLAEAAFHLGSVSLVLEFVRTGLVLPAFTLSDHIKRIEELAKRYADRHPDLADLCLVRMSELYPIIQ